MKIRNGFVSNSSSSSFIIQGKEVNIDEIKIDNKSTFIGVGKELGDGLDVIDINSYEILHAIRLTEYTFYNVDTNTPYVDPDDILHEIFGEDYWNMENDEMSAKLSHEVKGFCEYIDKDYHCSDSVDDIIWKYDLEQTENEIIASTKNYYRVKKLKKILK